VDSRATAKMEAKPKVKKVSMGDIKISRFFR
jgi:hypothetical protein